MARLSCRRRTRGAESKPQSADSQLCKRFSRTVHDLVGPGFRENDRAHGDERRAKPVVAVPQHATVRSGLRIPHVLEAHALIAGIPRDAPGPPCGIPPLAQSPSRNRHVHCARPAMLTIRQYACLQDSMRSSMDLAAFLFVAKMAVSLSDLVEPLPRGEIIACAESGPPCARLP